MSLQSVIDYHLSEAGGYNYNITIANESGDVTLPAHVNLHLFDCQPNKVTATEGDNAIFMARCQVMGQIEQADGSFIAENCQFIDEILWRKSNRVEVKHSTFYSRIKALTNTLVDIYQCGFEESPIGKDSYGIYCLTKARATVSNCTIKKRDKAAWAEDGAFIELVNCILGVNIGIHAENNAVVRMIEGQNKAMKIGVEMKNRSQVYLSQLSKPFIASDFHVKAEDHCRLHAEDTNFDPTATVAFKGSDHCVFEVVNFDHAQSAGGNCVDVDDNCEVLFISGSLVKSNGAKTILADNNCKVRAVSVKEIIADADDTVNVSNTTKFTATAGTSIKSNGKVAIRAASNSTVSVKKYSEVKSTAAEAVVLSDNARGWFASTDLVQSTAKDALSLSNEADVSFQNCGTIESTAKNGITAVDNCTVQLQTIKVVNGLAGHGVSIANNTNLSAVYVDLCNGKAGLGIIGANNCDIIYARSKMISGATGGIENVNGGKITTELIDSIMTDGVAITVIGGEVDVKKTTLSGKGGAISSANSTLTFENADITGTVTSDNDTYTLLRTALRDSDLIAQNSTINMEIGQARAMVFTNCTIDLERIIGELLSLIGSSGITKHGAYDSILVDVASNLMTMKTTGPVMAAGNVIAFAGGTINDAGTAGIHVHAPQVLTTT